MSDDPRVEIRSVTIPRTARYAVMGSDTGPVEEVWLACHGYGQLASRFIRRFDVVDNGRRLIAAPEALSRFYVSGPPPHSLEDKVGASWMTREDRDAEIADQVTYLDVVAGRLLATRNRSGIRFVAFGFSQGAATVCRWAGRTSAPPDNLILWGSGVPTDVLEGAARQQLARIAITIVVGARDPMADDDKVSAHRKQLEAAGLPYQLVRFEGGHEIDGAVLRDVARALSD